MIKKIRSIKDRMTPCHCCNICRSKGTSELPNPYEIKKEDLHKSIDGLGGTFGYVRRTDIGKRLQLKDGLIYMENEEQVEKRKGKNWRDKENI